MSEKLYSPVSKDDATVEDLDLPTTRRRKDGCCETIHSSQKLRFCLLIVVFVVLIAVVVVIAILIKSDSPKSAEVETDCFTLRGMESEGAYVFKGIPYAEPPVGDLRWKPPRGIEQGSARCDKSTLEATEFGSPCFAGTMSNVSDLRGSEDCLFLNVWTPTLDTTAKLPVMVWIHGGCLTTFNGNAPTYSPTGKLAKETNVVYVSMNYRLNAFGFMALAMLSDESETKTSGNYGFMDQIIVLEWVKRNVENFGGDPGKVTLFGQSSGGTSIHAILGMPKAKGLFHSVWMLSPSPVLNATLVEAEAANQKFLDNTGCLNTTCLRALTPTQVHEAIPWFEYPFWAMSDLVHLPVRGEFNGPLAIVDGVLLPEAPIDVWKTRKNSLSVPVMIGTTAQEADWWPGPEGVKTWTGSQYEDYVKTKLDTFEPELTKRALELYPLTNGSNIEFLITSMISDARVTCGTDILAGVMSSAAGSLPVYHYVTTARPSSPSGFLGFSYQAEFAFHGVDAIGFFGSMKDYIPLKDSDVAFQKLIRTEVLSFVRTGKVSSSAWKPYPNSTGLLGTNLTVVDSYQKERCSLWMSNGFFSYSWIN